MSIDSILGSSLQQALFQYADKNKDGSLDTTELKGVTTALTGQANPTDDQVAQLETQLDSNQDGKVGEAEFLQATVAQANTASLLDGGTMAALIGTGIFGNDSSNPYAALPGFSSGTDITNLYSSLIGNTLSASNGATADLTGELLSGALSTKGILA
jgi:hypothetical protein